jgi:5'-3' exonuclease
MGNTLLLVDGMAVLFRAYYASAQGGTIRRTTSGIPVNAVHGFFRYVFDALRTYEPTHLAVCWDLSSTTFRTARYAPYKANRGEPPEDLIPQFEIVKEALASLDIPNVGVQGYEADDCIGTMAHMYADAIDVLVLTGDQDLLQLVSERVRVVLMKKGFGNYAVYDVEMMRDEKGLQPLQVIDFKGLTGDSSDNYPGVRGIGEKTALKLLHEFGTIDGILANLDRLPASVRSKIEADLDMLHLCRELAMIHCEVPLSCTLDECRWTPQQERAHAKFTELEFHSLLKGIFL